MKLNDLIHKAAAGYPDERLLAFWDGQRAVANPAGGDTLAEFIVKELCDTFDAQADTPAQVAEAIRVLRRAQDELAGVIGQFSTAVENSKPPQPNEADQMIANAMALHHQLFVVEDNDSGALMEYDTLLADLEQMGYRPVTALRFEPIPKEDDDEDT